MKVDPDQQEAAFRAWDTRGRKEEEKPKEPHVPAQTEEHRSFIEARDKTARIGFLSPLTEGELQDKRVFLSSDRTVGYAIDKEGDFGNFFNNGPKGSGGPALIQGIKNGAKTLDCFDGRLPKLYSRYGFVVTGRAKFDDKHAPLGWNYEEQGRPDVVFMAYQGGDRGTIQERVGKFSEYDQKAGAYFDDYDQAKSSSRRESLP